MLFKRTHRFILIMVSVVLLLAVSSSYALPSKTYYASIRASEANVRTGPSSRYPIQCVYLKRNWPVKVLASFEQWRKIIDIDGEEGWIHDVLLTTSQRYGIVTGKEIVKAYRLPIPTAAATVMFEQGVIVAITQCQEQWCKVEASGHEGWLERKHLWGVEKDEVIQ
jgi:SH3-like domain-containing protein